MKSKHKYGTKFNTRFHDYYTETLFELTDKTQNDFYAQAAIEILRTREKLELADALNESLSEAQKP